MLKTPKNLFQLRKLKHIGVDSLSLDIYCKPVGIMESTTPLFYLWDNSDKSLQLGFGEDMENDGIKIVILYYYGKLN